MRYLVTGGRGVIGSLFARRLVAEGHAVTIIDDGTDRRHNANSFEGPSYHAERLEHMAPSRLTALVAASDRVFHAAASTGIPYSAEQPLDDWRRNVDGTLALLEALRVEPRPTVVLSSVKPYGMGLYGAAPGVSERYPLVPDEPYAASKAAQSLICQAYAISYDIPIAVFRCSNLWGPACCHGARHGWGTWFCIRAALGLPIEIQGSGEQARDMLYASDVGDAAHSAFSGIDGGLMGGEIMNLGGGRPNVISVLGLVAMLRSLGADITTTYGPSRKNEDQLFVTNHQFATTLLGWSPRVPVDTAAGAIYEWACNNREMLRRVYG